MLWYMNRCRVLRLQLHLSGQIDQFKIVYYEILDVPFYSCKTKFSKKTGCKIHPERFIC